MPLQFQNHLGESISAAQITAARDRAYQDRKPTKKKAAPDEYHKGWRVVGIPPGAMEMARDANSRLREMAEKAGGKPIKPFDPAEWLRKAKHKPVRSKPYELQESANVCAELARKAGWLFVLVVELKRASN